MKKTKGLFLFMIATLFLLVSMLPSNVYAYNNKKVPLDIQLFCKRYRVRISSCKDYYTKGKKHMGPHYFLPTPYYVSSPTCKRNGYAWLKCADANCKARRMYKTTLSLQSHTLNGKETLVSRGTCKRPAVYKIVCTSCGRKIRVKKTVDHDWITKEGHLVCRYCGKSGDMLFTPN